MPELIKVRANNDLPGLLKPEAPAQEICGNPSLALQALTHGVFGNFISLREATPDNYGVRGLTAPVSWRVI